jgi:hypothetical protein
MLTASVERGEDDTMRIEPFFLFDLDGTPVDSVCQHVLEKLARDLRFVSGHQCAGSPKHLLLASG